MELTDREKSFINNADNELILETMESFMETDDYNFNFEIFLKSYQEKHIEKYSKELKF